MFKNDVWVLQLMRKWGSRAKLDDIICLKLWQFFGISFAFCWFYSFFSSKTLISVQVANFVPSQKKILALDFQFYLLTSIFVLVTALLNYIPFFQIKFISFYCFSIILSLWHCHLVIIITNQNMITQYGLSLMIS